ncbi:M56 family metallopeptidase [Chitinophaga filiformis]|uniref:M48 family metalloprotease n=1 Tax=Chitinophaga filiformis TaxID=104663 RepID=A0ABY4HYB6_CHIFI|nr:M56 family metallopeptidase [Chitinophaga filiformis]UPK68413.1 M48 family metalloprotease [Chitinophaga filiformis]
MHPYLNLQSGGEQFLQAFSWMLIHSLWQGLLLALTTAILLQFTKRAPARLRYYILFSQFVLFILACIWTFFLGMSRPSVSIVPLSDTFGQHASQLLHINTINIQQFAGACAAYISSHASWLVLVWAVFFAFRSIRMVQGLMYLQRARHQYVYAAAGWQERLVLLCGKLHINKSIRLLESARIKAPMVIGHLKPAILMPVGLLSGMPVEQVEAVLLHELAHIRRHDYIVNLLQTFCETVYFFNPGLLWMSGRLRDEREHCCDDIALAQTGNKKEFIQALISFKEHAMYNHAAVAFPGRKNQLLQRVSRIINNKYQPLGTGEKVFFMAGILLLTVILSTAAITQLRSMEQDLAGIHHTARNYVLPMPSPLLPIAAVAPAKPTDGVTLQKNKRIKNAAAALSVITRDATISRESADEHYVEKLLADEIQPEQTEAAMPRDERRRIRPAYTAGNTQRANWSAFRRQYTPGNSQLPSSSSELHLTANGREITLSANEVVLRDEQREEARLAHIQGQKDRLQADQDRAQAVRDRIQAERNRAQADMDKERGRLDRIQAEKDRMQANLDRIQADNDRVQAEKDRAQANLDRIQADKDRARAEAERRQATQ